MQSVPVQSLSNVPEVDLFVLVGLAVTAAGLSGVVALIYRWYTREHAPGALPILVGLSGIALYMNTSQSLSKVISGNPSGNPLDETAALVNIVTFLVGGVAAWVGLHAGDRLGDDLFVATGARELESDVGRVVRAVGRVITVEIPEEIDDIVGYDPVPDETKEKLAGRTFVFPRRLTVGELRDRLVTRLKADYAVGHVDVEIADDGTVGYIALGSRAAGIGPTLPPETSAVAVRADPAFAASSGDLVQVWRKDPFERVLTGEVRGVVDDVVTLAVDAADTRKLDDATEYKLVTLPVEARPGREFASLLRAADETMAAVTIAAGSTLDGQPLGALDVSVAAVRPSDGPVEPLPHRDRLLAAGDTLYLVATPEAIRKLETGAQSSGGTTPTAEPGSEMPPDRRVDPATPVAGEAAESTDRADSASSTDAPDDVDEEQADEAALDEAGDDATPDADANDEPATGIDELDDGPGIETLADSDESADEPDDDGLDDLELGGPSLSDVEAFAPDDDAANGEADDDATDGEADGEVDGDGSAAGNAGDRARADAADDPEPSRDDLADLPGTDVDELTGTDVTDFDGSPAEEASRAGDGHPEGWTTLDSGEAPEEGVETDVSAESDESPPSESGLDEDDAPAGDRDGAS